MPPREKKYYKIGEVSRITGVEPHVLRYWESEFPQIKPRRVARQRLFRKEDLELIGRIRQLLHEEGFTISGARKQLAGEQDNSGRAAPKRVHRDKSGGGDSRSTLLKALRGELLEIGRLLDKI